jgi:predicted CoA-substrate-specific enzyme activase
MEENSRLVLEELFGFQRLPFNRLAVKIAVTGYGREKAALAISALHGRGCGTLTEISAHALGACSLSPGARTVIDAGGQDCKVIAVEDGRVLDFLMNDKCAAGSGRFLQAAALRLEADAADWELMLSCGKEARINSVCAVFAESEIIGLLACGARREDVLFGAAASVCRRIASLARGLPVKEPAVLCGGLSQSPAFCRILSGVLGVEVQAVPNGRWAGAAGAAIFAASQAAL